MNNERIRTRDTGADQAERNKSTMVQKAKMMLAAVAALHVVSMHDAASAQSIEQEIQPPAAARVLTPAEQARSDEALRKDIEESSSLERTMEELRTDLEKMRVDRERASAEREQALRNLQTPQEIKPSPLEQNANTITRGAQIAGAILQILERATRGNISQDDLKRLEDLRKEADALKLEKLPGQE